MKKLAKLLCAILSIALCFGCFSMVGCNPDKPDDQTQSGDLYDAESEEGAIRFSVQELDNVFNPYFATSGYDVEVTGMTQIGLLASDDNGNVYCGADEPSAALDYNQIITYNGKKYNADDPVESNRAPEITVDPSTIPANTYYTTYQFLLKNGIRFSDGEPLTIKDVVFNLYALLDPAYYGSATVYSTAIEGLAKYRTQDVTATNGGNEEAEINEDIRDKAMTRLKNLRYAYYPDDDANFREIYRSSHLSSADAKASVLKDVETARNMFYDEIMSGWKAAQSELVSYKEENDKAKTNEHVAKASKEFTEVWEIFLYNYGFITVDETVVEYEEGGKKQNYTEIKTYKSDDEASSHFDKNGNPHKAGDKMIDYGDYWKWFHDDSLPIILFENYAGIGDYQTDSEGNNIIKYQKNAAGTGVEEIPGAKAPVCDIKVDEQGHADGSILKGTEGYDDLLWNSSTLLQNFYSILSGSITAGNLQDQFMGEALSASGSGSGEMAVDHIDGIKIIQLNENDTFVGKNGTHQIDETSYVLQIKVDRVDPKALSNFGVTVAPMHYYSNVGLYTKDALTQEQIESFAKSDYDDFNYPVYNNKGEEIEVEGIYDSDKPICAGLKFKSREYFDKIVKNPDILAIPVGAGMYQVADKDIMNPYYLFEGDGVDELGRDKPKLGDDGQPILKYKSQLELVKARPKFSAFVLNSSIIHLIRNPFFFTTSGEIHGDDHITARDYELNKIYNCKIKLLRYQIITSDKVLDSIINGEIDYGDPAANTANTAKIQSNKNLTAINVQNNGYGYIGINAAYVPDLEVRRAIMMAMDTSLVSAYYAGSASIITRPISTCSWASPANTANPARSKVVSNGTKYTEDVYKYIQDTATLKANIRTMIANIEVGGQKYNINKTPYERKMADGTTHKLEYTFTIAGSTDDHPAYSTMQNAANILNDCGFKITVRTDAQALSKLAAGTLTVWAAAWSSGSDPDMYQIYHMDSKATSVNNWGYPTILANKGSADYSEQYEIIEELSDLIDDARTTLNQKTRAETYLDALNLIMDLAVEYPTYQRTNNYVFRNDRIDEMTINVDATPFYGPLAQMWKLELK